MAKIVNVNNFVIDHIIRGVMTKKSGDYMWSVNQIQDPSLNITTENDQAVDALGSVIAEFDRAKNAEFSANNSLFDLGLYAAQNGRDKEVASADSKIVCPAFETIEYDGETEDYTLKHKPTAPLTALYTLNGDGTIGDMFGVNTAASDTEFAYEEESYKITFPTNLAKGTQLFALYDYETESAVAVTVDAVNFPKSGRFVMEVLGADTCDPDVLIHAFVEFPNAKLDGNVDLSFAVDGTHPFTIRANQAYCDKEKKLFRIIIPVEE